MDDKETCEWWDEDGVWCSSCGVYFEFTCDGPKENNFNFCYKCGKKIEIKPVEVSTFHDSDCKDCVP